MDSLSGESVAVPRFIPLTTILTVILWIVYYIQFWYLNPTIQGLKKFPGASVWKHVVKIFLEPTGYRDSRALLSDWTRIYGNRFRVFIGHHFPLLIISSPEDMQVLVTHPDLLNRGHLMKQYIPWFGTNLLTAPAEKWKILKKSSSPFFAPRNLRALHPMVQSESNQLLHDLSKKNEENIPFDIRPFLIRYFFRLALLTTAGTASDRHVDAFIDGSKKFSKATASRVLKPWYTWDYLWSMTPSGAEQATAVQLLETAFKEAIVEGARSYDRLAEEHGGGRTLLEVLLKQREKGHTIFDSDDEILRTVMTVAGGASATTAVAVCWILHFLGSHPTEQKILQTEVDELLTELSESVTYFDLLAKMVKTEAFIYESMRLRPSIETMEREAAKDITLADGAVVPAGTLIIGLIGTTAKDPNIFPNPDKFDMSRFSPEARKTRHPYSFIPFSGGQRNCIGSLLAMVEMKTVLLNILSQFHIKAHCTLEEIGCNYYLGMHPKNAIKISLVKRDAV